MLSDFLKSLFDLTGIKHSPNLPRIINNAAWLVLDNAIRFILGFWVISRMAQYLGPANFGLFNYALAVVSIFSLFAAFGLNEILIRQIVTHPAHKDDIVTTAFFLRLITGSLSFLLCVILIIMLRPSGDITRWLTGIVALGLIVQAFDTIDLYFQSQLQSKYTVFAKNFVFIFLSFFRIYLIVTHAPLMTFAWAALAEIVLGAVGLACVYRYLGHRLVSTYNHIVAKDLMHNCWPVCCAGFAAMANLRIGQILLLHLRGRYEAGIYASASRIIDMWSVLGFVLIASTFPVIVRLKNDNEIIYRQTLKKFYKVIYSFGIAVSALTAVLSKPIIAILYGPAYHEAAPVLSVYVLSTIFIFMGGATSYVLVAENLQKYQLLRSLVGFISSVVLCLCFIPRWGALGAAVGTLISFVISVYVILIFKPIRKIF